MPNELKHVVALAGGVGGAKLAHGLYQALPQDALTVVVNTADDFVHWGLNVSPDIDTVVYTLSGIANEATGWGLANESWRAIEAIGRLGGETWFGIGDQDLATHIVRSQALREGQPLSAITATMATALGLHAQIVPMTDARVATIIYTADGPLAFQDYFVRRHHQDIVTGVTLEGIDTAAVAPGIEAALRAADAIIFCPSNPIVSIGPILAIPGMRHLLTSLTLPRVAVSPIVGGKALRGPADAMLSALGHESSALGVARLYQGVVSGMVIDGLDADDADQIRDLGMEVLVTDTIMRTIGDRQRLAAEILNWYVQL